MHNKKPVYNGYEEHYFTGTELKIYFKNRYYTTGRHHSAILGMEIPDYLDLLNLDDSKVYRVFVNANFCRVMDEKTDHRISFFGHASLDKSKHAIDPDKLHIQKICPLCGASMKLREGRFGEFLGCSHYPNCIYTAKIPVIIV